MLNSVSAFGCLGARKVPGVCPRKNNGGKTKSGRFRPQERKEREKGKEICFKELPLIEEVSVFLMPERHGKMRNTT